MINVSQNRKIAIAALAIFAISFALMLFFLDNRKGGYGEANVLETDAHETTQVEEYKEEISFVTDSGGLVLYAREEFCGSVGLACADMMGKSLFDLVHNDDLGKFVKIHSKILQDKEIVELAGPFRLTADAERLVLLNIEPVIDEEKVSELKFAVKDVTDQVNGAQVEPADSNETPDSEGDDDWTDKIYPKIEELNDGGRLMVDKITYLLNKK